ncbi:transposase family protein [Kitasatospora cineracea]
MATALTAYPNRITVHDATTSGSAACPSCGTASARVHSCYEHRLDDASVGGRPVVIELRVRRFRCRETTCPRITFAEQVAGLTFRHGRRSQEVQAVLRQVALMLAGHAGARLADALAAPVGRSTLLRLIRTRPPERASDASCIGRRRVRSAQGPRLRHRPGRHRDPPGGRPAPSLLPAPRRSVPGDHPCSPPARGWSPVDQLAHLRSP